MITPTKYMNLDLSVLRVSSIIIKVLRKKRIMEYNEVLNIISEKTESDVKEYFQSCLNLLFLLGKINYHLETDNLEFIEQK